MLLRYYNLTNPAIWLADSISDHRAIIFLDHFQEKIMTKFFKIFMEKHGQRWIFLEKDFSDTSDFIGPSTGQMSKKVDFNAIKKNWLKKSICRYITTMFQNQQCLCHEVYHKKLYFWNENILIANNYFQLIFFFGCCL